MNSVFMSNVLQNLKYRLVYGFFWLLSLLPMAVLYVISDFIYLIVYYVVRYRRNVVRQNIAGSFPDKDKAYVTEVERGFYHFFCDYIVENIKLFSMSKKEMMKRMTFSGLDDARQRFENGKDFLFLYLGHYGNWEWIASLQYWMPYAHCTQIYHPLYNKIADKIFIDLREQYGGECIPMKKTLRRILQMKKEGLKVVVGFISDQLPKWNSIHHFTHFLNRETAVFTGTEEISKKIGAMVYYGRMTRPKRGYYHCDLILMTDSPEQFEDFDLTDMYMRMLETDIVENPAIWLWSHKRWRRTKERWLERQKAGLHNG